MRFTKILLEGLPLLGFSFKINIHLIFKDWVSILREKLFWLKQRKLSTEIKSVEIRNEKLILGPGIFGSIEYLQ